jgi:CheY-like chemotaxis protein
MQIIRSFGKGDVAAVGLNVRVLVLTAEGEDGQISRRLASLGGKVEVVDELYSALSDLIDDPAGYGLFVIDCDMPNVGGLEAARRAMLMLGDVAQRVPVVLISSEIRDHSFPLERPQPTMLRAPLSMMSLKEACDHALRGRMLHRAA